MSNEGTPVEVKTATTVVDDAQYPTREMWTKNQQSDQLLGLVSTFLAGQGLPKDQELAAKVRDFAEGCLLDRGLILKYFPPEDLVEVSQNEVLKIAATEPL